MLTVMTLLAPWQVSWIPAVEQKHSLQSTLGDEILSQGWKVGDPHLLCVQKPGSKSERVLSRSTTKSSVLIIMLGAIIFILPGESSMAIRWYKQPKSDNNSLLALEGGPTETGTGPATATQGDRNLSNVGLYGDSLEVMEPFTDQKP